MQTVASRICYCKNVIVFSELMTDESSLHVVLIYRVQVVLFMFHTSFTSAYFANMQIRRCVMKCHQIEKISTHPHI